MGVAPHRAGQAQCLHRPVSAAGTGLAPTCACALTRLGQPLTVAELARHAGLGSSYPRPALPRRNGTTPQRWLAAQRLLQARHLLEASDLSIDQVADRAGPGSPS